LVKTVYIHDCGDLWVGPIPWESPLSPWLADELVSFARDPPLPGCGLELYSDSVEGACAGSGVTDRGGGAGTFAFGGGFILCGSTT
jgi:hypothetical protein